MEPLVIAVPVPDGIDSQHGIGNKPSLGQHCSKEQLQKSRHRTFWESLSQKCDSIEQGSGDMTVSLVVHSGLLRECFLSRGRALLTPNINYVRRARPIPWVRCQAFFC